VRKAYIDCGAYDGDTARLFLRQYPKAEEYEVYCFDPDTRVAISKSVPRGTLLFTSRRAVWTHDGEIPLYLGDLQSSSVIKSKNTGDLDKEHPVTVPCFDFPHWFNRFEGYDHVVLKLDIEGAEYPVLERMMSLATLELVHVLYVDWHWDKIGMPREEHEAFVNKVTTLYGLNPVDIHEALRDEKP
jgi:FkbM family methyltransferase